MKLVDRLYQYISIVVTINLVILLIIPPIPTLAQTLSGRTSPTDFVLITSNPPGEPVAKVLLEDIKPYGNGVRATLKMEVNTAIAYMVDFQQFPEQTTIFEELGTLPLYQTEEPILVSQITLKPGEKIVIRQDKLGGSVVNAAVAVLVDLSLLWMYLIGQEKIPTNTAEGISSFFQAYTNIQQTKFIAEVAKFVNDIRSGADRQIIEDDVIDLMLSKEIHKLIPEISGELLKVKVVLKFGSYLNDFFDYYERVGRIKEAISDLAGKPHHVETTIILVPFITDLPEFPVVDPRNDAEITFTMQNISGETWKAGDYSLVNIEGKYLSPWAREKSMDTDVPPGNRIKWKIPVTVPAIPGVYRIAWQFSYKGVPGGPPIWADLIVVPAGSSGEFRAIIQGLVDQARKIAQERFEAEWAKIREQIIELIWAEIRRLILEITKEVCCGGPAAGLPLLWTVLLLRRRRSNGSEVPDDKE